jgi:hypothetical protein
LFVFDSSGVLILDLELAKQVLYLLSQPSPFFALVILPVGSQDFDSGQHTQLID